MPEYCITTKEIWYGYLRLEAADVDDAVHRAKNGEGDISETDYGDTIGYVSIRDENTGEETDLENPIIIDENNPNSIFTKSKKQEEVDKVIGILNDAHLNSVGVEKGLEILRNIKSI